MNRRSPYGERGLKLLVLSWHEGLEESLSLRRAWIEIPTGRSAWWCSTRRSPYGERGLKYIEALQRRPALRRSPYGERGLKF